MEVVAVVQASDLLNRRRWVNLAAAVAKVAAVGTKVFGQAWFSSWSDV